MVAGIILAAGFSRRMAGQNKLLLKLKGQTMIERVILAALASDLDDLVVVYREQEIKEISDKYQLSTIENKNAIVGQSESIKLGVRSCSPQSRAFVFFVGDQPFVTKDQINQLIKSFNINQDSIIVPLYAGKNGSPVLFPDCYKDRLLALTGDSGGRSIIKEGNCRIHYEMMSEGRAGMDIDTWDDYLKIKNVLNDKF